MDGLGCLGVEEAVGADAKAAAKRAGAKTIEAIAKEIEGSIDDKKPDQPKSDKGVDSGLSWFTKPAVGPLPGWSVIAGLAAALGGGWWYFKK